VFIIAVIPKFGAMLLLIKIMHLFFAVFIKLEFFFSFCAAASILFGSISALYQVRLKRFLAYSSISNFGYILLTLSFWPGILSTVFATQYLFIYILLLIGLFGLLLNLRQYGSFANINTISELGVLSQHRQPLA